MLSHDRQGGATGEAGTLDERGRTPRHGFRGDGSGGARPALAAGLTIALSREAGSRGSTIGSRAGAKLGWPVYNQELLEYMAQEGALARQEGGPPRSEAAAWVEEQLRQLLESQNVSRHPSVVGLARVVLNLAAAGEVILIGRGAGLLLPHALTLHVRVVAPPAERVAYMAQWLRLTEEEAAAQVCQRDARRAEFLAAHFRHAVNDLYQYDLVLNSSLLGEEVCAELIAQAARGKARALSRDSTDAVS
jgi:cytidylate kinase